MDSDVEAGYHQAITDLGVRKRWYQTDTDLYYAAVVGAVDGVDNGEILARAEQLDAALPPTHDLHLITHSLAAITAARDLEVDSYVANVDAVTESLREAVRSKRLRRLAGAVLVAANDGGFEVVGNRIATIHKVWNDRHRVLTNALDLSLAAITDAAGLDPFTAMDRTDLADGRLREAGYKNEWDATRILAVDRSGEATERFLRLASERRGRRRKPLTDRRHLIAIASLADHSPQDLVDVMSHRLEALRVSKFRPDRRTTLTLAALLTLGASVPDESRLRTVFHGFVMREHYVNSYAEANSG